MGLAQKSSFETLKRSLITAPVLILPDQQAALDGSRPFEVQTDASAVALGGTLSQRAPGDEPGALPRPIAFESRQFSAAEQNYHAGEREPCAIGDPPLLLCRLATLPDVY